MYRIYDKEHKRWRDDMIMLPNGALAIVTKNMFGKYKMKVIWDEESYVVHNETGIDDKNGYRIFEGDVCRCPQNSQGIVAYSTQVGSYCIFDYDNDLYYIITDETAKDCEIIGTVFNEIVINISDDENREVSADDAS